MGLLLSGGGALCAWQAGALDALVRAGLAFDRVLGFSGGALTGLYYCLGWDSNLLDRWRRIDEARVLRLSPRWKPFSLYSDAPIWEAVREARDDDGARTLFRAELTVVSLRLDDRMPVYFRFTPGGERGWDAPLARRVVASCSIPDVFPPVRMYDRGIPATYVDGGVPGEEWMRCDALAGCADVLALELVRPEEIGRRRWTPWARFDQKSREVIFRQVDGAVRSLSALPDAPRVFRLRPSQTLEFTQLQFRGRHCAPAVELGVADALSFLGAPEGARYGAK